ncbi:hypothetical protein BC826DRAFT_1157576 [Russula brevipes]|nr:hypothetical protein BC826DRAFT_1157576 [Russula brevipes]
MTWLIEHTLLIGPDDPGRMENVTEALMRKANPSTGTSSSWETTRLKVSETRNNRTPHLIKVDKCLLNNGLDGPLKVFLRDDQRRLEANALKQHIGCVSAIPSSFRIRKHAYMFTWNCHAVRTRELALSSMTTALNKPTPTDLPDKRRLQRVDAQPLQKLFAGSLRTFCEALLNQRVLRRHYCQAAKWVSVIRVKRTHERREGKGRMKERIGTKPIKLFPPRLQRDCPRRIPPF